MSEAAPPRDASANGRTWTVLDLLRWTTRHFEERGIESARLDAECLLAHALGGDRLRLYLDFEKPVTEAERGVFRELVRRRAAERRPVAQLLGEKEFWSLALRVTADVLTPRPDTETLVAAALERLPERDAAYAVLELGTGSGAVALALAHERPHCVVFATDVSEEALKVAQENAERHGMAERIRFAPSDLYEAVAERDFDLVVSNPPYVGEGERGRLDPELAHEPERALFAGPEGLDVLTPLVAGAPARLRPGAALAVEIGAGQAEAVGALCRGAGLEAVEVHRDLGGRPRVVTARRPAG